MDWNALGDFGTQGLQRVPKSIKPLRDRRFAQHTDVGGAGFFTASCGFKRSSVMSLIASMRSTTGVPEDRRQDYWEQTTWRWINYAKTNYLNATVRRYRMSNSAPLERKRGDTGIVKIREGAVGEYPDEEFVMRCTNDTITQIR